MNSLIAPLPAGKPLMNSLIAPLPARKPLMNAYARATQLATQKQLAQLALAKKPNVVNAFAKLPPGQLAQRPWSAIAPGVHAKDAAAIAAAGVHAKDAAAIAAAGVHAKEVNVVHPAAFILPHRDADAMIANIAGAKNKESDATIAAAVGPVSIPETKPAVRIPSVAENMKPSDPVKVVENLKPSDPVKAAENLKSSEPAKVVGTVVNPPAEVANAINTTTTTADDSAKLKEQGDDKSDHENAQAKKNINNMLSSVDPSGDLTVKVSSDKITSSATNASIKTTSPASDESSKITASADKPADMKNGTVETTRPQASSRVVNENPQKYGNEAVEGDAREQVKLWANETMLDNSTSPSSPTSPASPILAVKDTDVPSGILSGFGTPISNASTISVSVEKLDNSADARSVDTTNTSLANPTNATVGKKDEQPAPSIADDKSLQLLANGTKSLTEMDLIESEINHGAATLLQVNTTGATGADELKDSGKAAFSTAAEQLDTIDTIESQFKSGALSDETSQLKVNGKELDTLPSDVVAKLPYTRDDKKETIPLQTDDSQSDVDVFIRDRV